MKMNKKVTISLSALILLLLVIIAAGVYELYRGVPDCSKELETLEQAVAETATENKVSETPETTPAETAIAQTATETKSAVQTATENKSDAQTATETKPAKTAVKPADTPKAKKAPAAPKVKSVKVRNCGTGKQNTLRQNADNSIELIDEKGKSLWKRQMDAPWGGAVAQVDHFYNKKIQFLLAVGKNIYLIDRKGRDVKGFPKSIPFEAVSGPISVKTSKGGSAWKIETSGDPVYLDARAKKVLTQLP